jgi:hypothetical protein
MFTFEHIYISLHIRGYVYGLLSISEFTLTVHVTELRVIALESSRRLAMRTHAKLDCMSVISYSDEFIFLGGVFFVETSALRTSPIRELTRDYVLKTVKFSVYHAPLS